MAQLRLNVERREALKRLAKEIVACPAEAAAEAAAYKKAAPLVRKIVEAKYPPRDMKVLVKYGVAKPEDCIRITTPWSSVEEFRFAEAEAPIVVRRSCDYRGQIYLADREAAAAVVAWRDARKAHKEALERKLADYYALINGAASLEDVSAIWPEAETIRPRFQTQALTVLTEDVVNRIRADVAARQKAA